MTKPIGLVELTDDQKKVALENAATLDVTALTRLVFGSEDLDARGIEGRSLKAFLAGEKVPVQVKNVAREALPPVILTEEQIAKISELAPKCQNSLEVARLVWNEPTLKIFDRKWRAVFAVYKEIYKEGVEMSEEPVDEKEYAPPNSEQSLVGQLNEYIPTGEVGRRLYNWGKLTAAEKRQVRALMSYIRIYHFKYYATSFKKKTDREMYISTFYRFTHEKPDLTPEEQDQYVLAAVETVTISVINRQLDVVDKLMADMLSGDAEGRGKLVAVVELINSTRTQLNNSKEKLNKQLASLVGNRASRLKDRDQRNSSLVNLVDEWQRNEQKRLDIIELGIQEKMEDMAEVGRIRDIDDVTALISGQTEEEGGLG